MREPAVWVDALGICVRIDVSAQLSWLSRVQQAWSGATIEPPPTDAYARTVTVNGLGQFDELEAALSWLSSAVTLAAMEARAGELWMLHAGAVADSRGRVVAFVGPSGAGKTTLTRAVGRQYGYVSDETVGIDPDGTVTPFRKPLSIVTVGATYKQQCPPRALGLRELPDAPLQLAAIVVLNREIGSARPARLVPLGAPEALGTLAPHSSSLPTLSQPLHTIADHLSRAPVLRLDYGDRSDLSDVVAQALRAEPDGEPVRSAEVSPGATSRWRDPGCEPDATGELLARVAPLDAVICGQGQLVVLVPDTSVSARLVVLGGISLAIWREAVGVSFARLVEAVVAEHGAPPAGVDTVAAVSEAVGTMCHLGLLSRC